MKDIHESMLIRAQQALHYAYAPYSNFKVAACIYTEQGHLYSGVNVENDSYSLTLCAEASAIASMVSAGEQAINKILILAGSGDCCPPCGACRQRIFEFAKTNTEVLLCRDKSIMSITTIHELLPLAFNFKHQ